MLFANLMQNSEMSVDFFYRNRSKKHFGNAGLISMYLDWDDYESGRNKQPLTPVYSGNFLSFIRAKPALKGDVHFFRIT